MIVLLSPAKTLDYETPLPTRKHSEPELLAHSAELADELKPVSPADLRQLMGISQELADLNVERFQKWRLPFTPENSRPALFAFKGDVYEGLDAYTLNKEQIDFAQKHVRILSGLYGMLRPLDLMQPYRLEMGTRFSNSRGKNLYEFWGNLQTDLLQNELDAGKEEAIVLNLASNEYFRVIRKKVLKARLITPAFLDYKKGEYKMISFYAKRARGLMARYVIERKVRKPEALQEFDCEGYRYDSSRSEADKPVFIRDEVSKP